MQSVNQRIENQQATDSLVKVENKSTHNAMVSRIWNDDNECVPFMRHLGLMRWDVSTGGLLSNLYSFCLLASVRELNFKCVCRLGQNKSKLREIDNGDIFKELFIARISCKWCCWDKITTAWRRVGPLTGGVIWQGNTMMDEGSRSLMVVYGKVSKSARRNAHHNKTCRFYSSNESAANFKVAVAI